MMPSRSCAFSRPTCSSTIRSRAAIVLSGLGLVIVDLPAAARAALFCVYPNSAGLWLQRGEIGAGRQQIVRPEMGNDGGHERGPGPVPVAALHVIELPHGVAR